jgi:outer membrane beta-barrel protein
MKAASETRTARAVIQASDARTGMMRRTRLLGSCFAGALALASMAAAKPAAAQEIQITGPLAGAPAVRKLRLHREGRFEVAPSASFTLLDEYKRTILVGARLQYNVKDWIGVGVWGAYGLLQTPTDLSDQIDNNAIRNSRTASNVAGAQPGGGAFQKQLSEMQWVAAPQIQLVPFRGKLSLFQNIFVDTDAYLHLGVAFVGLNERGDCGGNQQALCTEARSFALQSRTAIAPTFGLGLNFYTGNLVSIGVEYRALPFSWNRAGFDSRGSGPNGKYPNGLSGTPIVNSDDQTFKFNQMITVAVGFALPTKPRISD